MAAPNSKATLKEYALRRLGKPVLEVNVADDQIDDALDYTIEKFQEYHYGGSERMYMSINSLLKISQDSKQMNLKLVVILYKQETQELYLKHSQTI